MAVYTQLEAAQLKQFLADFEVGQLVDFQGIEGGIENTNYFVTTQNHEGERRFVLTLFEELSAEEMPYFVELALHLADQGVLVPAPVRDRYGIALKQLAHRPALLLPRMAGGHLSALDAEHCRQIGSALAEFHIAGRDFFMTRQAHRGVFWWRRESKSIAQLLSAEDAELLRQEVLLFDQLRREQPDLPQGAIHGDLFHDNALFHEGRLSAIIDIYNACQGYLLYDLAIVANDWCVESDGRFNQERLQALLSAYAAKRPFEACEQAAWPVLTRTAAMRFWLSRLISFHGLETTRYEGEQVIKDPDEFKRILLQRIETPSTLL